MFVNIVVKYGLVPKTIYPETQHSQSSRSMNKILTSMLKKYIHHARQGKLDKKKAMDKIYNILCQFLGGPPPKKFTWEYFDKDGQFKCISQVTPHQFYANHVNVDLKEYISIIHDPRNEYHCNYSVKHLNNMVEGDTVQVR